MQTCECKTFVPRKYIEWADDILPNWNFTPFLLTISDFVCSKCNHWGERCLRSCLRIARI
jgi:hypothetical protein